MARNPGLSGGRELDVALSPQQVAFFEAFGFLRLPGLLCDRIGEITAAFEEVFASDVVKEESIQRVHDYEPRLIVSNITDHHEVLGRLPRDPGVHAIVQSLMGQGQPYEYAGSDGNLYFCDTYWHSDIFGSPLRQFHVKFSIYLDPVDESSGAIRVIPGSHFINEGFSRSLRKGFKEPTEVESAFGVSAIDIPAVVLPSRPGDVIVWNYRIVHAAFNGPPRRRHLSFGFRQLEPADEPTSDGRPG
jgi:hypothetical protein